MVRDLVVCGLAGGGRHEEFIGVQLRLYRDLVDIDVLEEVQECLHVRRNAHGAQTDADHTRRLAKHDLLRVRTSVAMGVRGTHLRWRPFQVSCHAAGVAQ